ncbi:hypothetical protein ERO13_D03G056650v2 [Gossypium hirsutum]|uniref:Uncharacterized protein n=3 Tax=Gossypium TaxID=3633 RepID=A0A5J5S238_GOSBA|nr:hypothetical protein ES319_D03G060900v1 [Gossypium barbadense]KAG4154433.1 hypothetical protein ERO13_D03G056650v2 [Gossypium hirsutum]TYH79448.1 hypothetical protein ES332_D03G065000v1 [Gossypium tomentosum]TYI89537.1 hypothetical protein E1A91_D03G062900v1 [Gossypium mustelinum]
MQSLLGYLDPYLFPSLIYQLSRRRKRLYPLNLRFKISKKMILRKPMFQHMAFCSNSKGQGYLLSED